MVACHAELSVGDLGAAVGGGDGRWGPVGGWAVRGGVLVSLAVVLPGGVVPREAPRGEALGVGQVAGAVVRGGVG